MGALFNSSWAALAVYCCEIKQWNDLWNYTGTAKKNLLLVLFNFSFLLFSVTTWGRGAWVWRVGFISGNLEWKMAGRAFLAFSESSHRSSYEGKVTKRGQKQRWNHNTKKQPRQFSGKNFISGLSNYLEHFQVCSKWQEDGRQWSDFWGVGSHYWWAEKHSSAPWGGS